MAKGTAVFDSAQDADADSVALMGEGDEGIDEEVIEDFDMEDDLSDITDDDLFDL